MLFYKNTKKPNFQADILKKIIDESIIPAMETGSSSYFKISTLKNK